MFKFKYVSLYSLIFTAFCLLNPVDSMKRKDSADDHAEQGKRSKVEQVEEQKKPIASFEEKVNELINPLVEQGEFSGSVLVAKEGKILVCKGYGYADQEKKILNTPNTPFLIGSLSKAFTAALIMQLQEQKKLDVHDSVSKHLPEFPHKEVTIHHVLCHTSGLQRSSLAKDKLEKFTHLDAQGRVVIHAKSIDQLVNYFIKEPLTFTPGEGYSYSNAGYILLTKLIEIISGKSYETCLQENILHPLKMNNSFCFYKSTEARCPQSYLTASCTYLKEIKKLGDREDFESFDDGCVNGDGSIVSTIKDMYLWDRALYEAKILSEKSKQVIFTPNKEDYGYGWEIDDLFEHKSISHNGAENRFISHISRFTDDDACIIILSNMHTYAVFNLGKRLAALLFEKKDEITPSLTPKISLDQKILEKYVGTYVSPKDNQELTFQVVNGKLTFIDTPYQLHLFPLSENRFFNHTFQTDLTFESDESGKELKLCVKQIGSEATFNKRTS